MIAYNNSMGNNYDYYSLDYIEKAAYWDDKGWYDANRLLEKVYFNTYNEKIEAFVFESILNFTEMYFKNTYNLHLVNYGNCKDCSISAYIASEPTKRKIKTINIILIPLL